MVNFKEILSFFKVSEGGSGLQIRVRIEILSSLFLIQNIWLWYSKEPSQ